MAAIALTIRLAAGAPRFSRQTRPGYKGKPFTLLKFRTMTCCTRRARPFLARCGKTDADWEAIAAAELGRTSAAMECLPRRHELGRSPALLMQYMDRYTPGTITPARCEARNYWLGPGERQKRPDLARKIRSRSLVRRQLEPGSGCLDSSSDTVASLEARRYLSPGSRNYAGILRK